MAGYYVGLGGQKCGTGWVSSTLKAQPEVLSHCVKEMHVFDCLFSRRARRYWVPRFEREVAELEQRLAHVEHQPSAARERRRLSNRLRDHRDHLNIFRARRRSTSFDLYRRYFTDRIAEAGEGSPIRWFGEITPAYALLSAAELEDIMAVCPDAHFIFVMRDPIDRFWSGLKLRQHWDASRPDPIATFGDALRSPWLVKRSAYDLTLAAMDAVVPPANRLVLFYEDLFGPAGEEELHRISTFFHLDHLVADRSDIKNTGGPSRMPRELEEQATAVFLPTYRSIRDRFGRLPDRWQARLEETSAHH